MLTTMNITDGPLLSDLCEVAAAYDVPAESVRFVRVNGGRSYRVEVSSNIYDPRERRFETIVSFNRSLEAAVDHAINRHETVLSRQRWEIL